MVLQENPIQYVLERMAHKTACYIQGIAGNTVTSSAPVLIDTANGQLGTVSSSLRYKKDIVPMEDQTEKVMQLRPVNFRYKENDAQMQYGLIAEEAAKQYPEFIAYDKSGQIYSINYLALVPVLIKQIQEMEKELQKQANELQEQANEIKSLKQEKCDERAYVEMRINELRALIAQLIA